MGLWLYHTSLCVDREECKQHLAVVYYSDTCMSGCFNEWETRGGAHLYSKVDIMLEYGP